MIKKLFLTLGCMVLTGLLFVTGCSNGKSINPVAPESESIAAQVSDLSVSASNTTAQTSTTSGQVSAAAIPAHDKFNRFRRTKTLTWKGPYDTVTVTYRGNRRITKVARTGFRTTYIIYADTKSSLRNNYPGHSNSAQRDLTCPDRPGEVLTIGFTAGHLSYIVQKRPGRDIFCYYIDSYYKIYDGTYTHRITEYPRR